ncbi:MAG: hypothetical protein ABEH40_01365 [Haloferacaceae archaeon]
MRRRRLLTLAAALSGCGARPVGDATPRPGTTDGTAGGGTDAFPAGAAYGYTHLRPDGNRVVPGTGGLPDARPVDVALPGRPAWLVAAADGDATVWGVRLADGRDRIYRLDGRSVSRVAAARAPGTGPPLLSVAGGRPRLRGGARPTHPVPVPGAPGAAAVRPDGRLALPDGPVAADALPDARVVTDGDRLYLLAGPTGRYGHGVLGDGIEATAVAAVDPGTRSVRHLRPPDGVVEGLVPTVTDVDGDGRPEVVVTASDAEVGARLVALRPDGDAATGPPVGRGYRWRHRVAVAPFGPEGGVEIAAVRTPHLGGVAEFYRAEGDRLVPVAERAGGYATHRIGSRNLGMAAAGDLDGDGRPELLVPDGEARGLVALRRTAGGVSEAWRVPLGGRLETNLAAAVGAGGAVLGAGRPGTLRLWPGE